MTYTRKVLIASKVGCNPSQTVKQLGTLHSSAFYKCGARISIEWNVDHPLGMDMANFNLPRAKLVSTKAVR
jgi:hypothetical protein